MRACLIIDFVLFHSKRSGGRLRADTVSIKSRIRGPRSFRRTYLYLRRANKARVVLFVSLCFLLVVGIGLMGYLLVQDFAHAGRMFNGVTIDGKPVGGMTRAQARTWITQNVATPIEQPMVLTQEDNEFTLDLKSIDLSVDVDKMVETAYWKGQDQNIVMRLFRRFLSKPVHVNVPVMLSYDEKKVEAFVAGIAEDLDFGPRSVSIDVSGGVPVIRESRYGLEVKQKETVEAIEAAMPTNNRNLTVVTASLKPDITEADLGYIIVIKQAEHTLYLYRGEVLDSKYAVAVGSPQYPTPNGKFYIRKKQKDPTWYPPKSDWAKDKQTIPPGPGNPLGPYWMELGDGLGIHSTPDEKSLGFSVSHGCIRLSEWSAMMIFDKVNEGTPVFIMP
ncbi:MAG: L,D-transpeptidase/peptidoglycan binding protein [Actinomycetota bacterium]